MPRTNVNLEKVNFGLIRKWIEVGSPNIQDLAAMLGVYALILIKVFSGKAPADKNLRRALSLVFDCKEQDIF